MAVLLLASLTSAAEAAAVPCIGLAAFSNGYSCLQQAIPGVGGQRLPSVAAPDADGDGTDDWVPHLVEWVSPPEDMPREADLGTVELSWIDGRFTLYGIEYSSFRIGLNGYVTFGTAATAPVTVVGSLPSATYAAPAIFAYGTDVSAKDRNLGGGAGQGGVYWDDEGNCFGGLANCLVVEWNEVEILEGDGTATFRLALLYAGQTGDLSGFDNRVYVEVEGEPLAAAGSPLLLGLQNGAGTRGLSFSGDAAAGTQVVFAPDTVGPSVTATTPAHGATGISVDAGLVVDFDEPMDTTSVTIDPRDGTPNANWTTAWTAGNTKATVSFNGDLLAAGAVQITVFGTDVDGNLLAGADNGIGDCAPNNVCFGFTTVDDVAPPALSHISAAAAKGAGASVALDWDQPIAEAPTRVLVVRSTDKAALEAFAPSAAEPGHYTTGETFGAVVVAQGDDLAPASLDGATDTAPAAGSFHYRAFAVDPSFNYSTADTLRVVVFDAADPVAWSYSTLSQQLGDIGSTANSSAADGVSATSSFVFSGGSNFLQQIDWTGGSRKLVGPSDLRWANPSFTRAIGHRPVVGDLAEDPLDPAYVAFVGESSTGVGDNPRLWRVDLTSDNLQPRQQVAEAPNNGCGWLAGPAVLLASPNPAGSTGMVLGTSCGDGAVNRLQLHSLAGAAVDTIEGSLAAPLPDVHANPLVLYGSGGANSVVVPFNPFLMSNAGATPPALRLYTVAGGELTAGNQVTWNGADRNEILFTPAVLRNGGVRRMLVGDDLGYLDILDNALANPADTDSRFAPVPAGPVGLEYEDDGFLHGVAASSPLPAPQSGNWAVWTTDTKVHVIKVDGTGAFDASSYAAAVVESGAGTPSAPLVLRNPFGSGVGDAGFYIFVGNSVGELHILKVEETLGTVTLVPRAGTPLTLDPEGGAVGNPTFDFGTGPLGNQGLIVGTSKGLVVRIQFN